MLYLDSSALLKRYVLEPGRAALEERLRDSPLLFTSFITYAEVHAALAAKFRNTHRLRGAWRQLREHFETNWTQMKVVAVTEETLMSVPALVARWPLRGTDAVHLSAALWVGQQLGRLPDFVVSDRRLSHVARAIGFSVFNPEEAEG